MGKRLNFKRRAQDAYDTPMSAVIPLVRHLPSASTFWEPCAGARNLVHNLEAQGMDCLWASDIEPRAEPVTQCDALLQNDLSGHIDYIITNPPWTRQILHPMIEHFSDMRPTWLLFDADWMHTMQAAPFMWRLRKIVSVGRVSWMQNGISGKDNCCWYLFDAKGTDQPRFFGRAA